MDVVIVDSQISNLHSVQAACLKVGLSFLVTTDPKKVAEAKALILPGVGAFGAAMENLKKNGLDEAISRFVESGKPLFGICLGLQLLFERSEEFGDHTGLGLIPGRVRRFRYSYSKGVRYPVPQIGWNRICENGKSWDSSLMSTNHSGEFMYFVHSYFVEPTHESDVLSISEYGDQKYCSAVAKNNIFATQFHPEKSGAAGIRIYEQLKNRLEVS